MSFNNALMTAYSENAPDLTVVSSLCRVGCKNIEFGFRDSLAKCRMIAFGELVTVAYLKLGRDTVA